MLLRTKIFSIQPWAVKFFWDKILQSDIGRRIAIGAFWSLAGSVISRGLMLLASIIIARILGKNEYGELGMIRSTVNMFAVFAGFGLGLTATKYIAEYRFLNIIKTGKIIGLSTIFAGVSGGLIALVILIFAPYLAIKTINAPHLIYELRLGAIILFFSALNGAQTGILAGFEAFKTIAKVNFISGLIAFPIQVIFTITWGLTGSVIGYGTNFLFLWFLNFVAVRKESQKLNIKIDFFHPWEELHVLYKFSVPALFSGVLVTPVLWACNTILVNQTDGYEEMAVFDAANQWAGLILFIPGTISQIALPMLSQLRNERKLYKKVLLINLLINTFTAFLMSLIISILSPIVMNFYGETFKNGFITLILLAFSSILISANNIIGKVIASLDKMWVGFWFNALWAVIHLSSSYILIKKGYGSVGLALAFNISYIFHSIVQIIYLKRKILKSENV